MEWDRKVSQKMSAGNPMLKVFWWISLTLCLSLCFICTAACKRYLFLMEEVFLSLSFVLGFHRQGGNRAFVLSFTCSGGSFWGNKPVWSLVVGWKQQISIMRCCFLFCFHAFPLPVEWKWDLEEETCTSNKRTDVWVHGKRRRKRKSLHGETKFRISEKIFEVFKA